jgi:hypothetical protein
MVYVWVWRRRSLWPWLIENVREGRKGDDVGGKKPKKRLKSEKLEAN